MVRIEDSGGNNLRESGLKRTKDCHESLMRRIHERFEAYDSYNFSMIEVQALNLFYDLAQEVHDMDTFYAICMMIPQFLFNLDSSIYLRQIENDFALVGCTRDDSTPPPSLLWDEVCSSNIVSSDQSVFVAMRCNPEFADLLPFEPPQNIIGIFEFSPRKSINDEMLLFLEKYVDRVGFKLHNRLVRDRNREHLSFIKSMVQDIGHNVIVPNMYFKLYFNRLKRKIENLHMTTEHVLGILRKNSDDVSAQQGNALAKTVSSIEAQYQEIYRHYETTSLFLETLLRRSHFEEGQYVLMKREVDLWAGVMESQLERYRQRFEEQNIRVEAVLSGAMECSLRGTVDPGLIAQVFANFFSNALKYTEEIAVPQSKHGHKALYYGWTLLEDYFGPEQFGVKLWIASTGRPLELQQSHDVFKPGFRANNATHKSGTGRGLYFVRQVVELHGGTVGYEYTRYGNEFSIVLPFEQKLDA